MTVDILFLPINDVLTCYPNYIPLGKQSSNNDQDITNIINYVTLF